MFVIASSIYLPWDEGEHGELTEQNLKGRLILSNIFVIFRVLIESLTKLVRLLTMSSQDNNIIYVTSVIATYWVVSITMVYLNKMLLSNAEASISAPLFVTWYQCVLSCVICVVLGNLGERTRSRGISSYLNQFPKLKYDLKAGGIPILIGITILETWHHYTTSKLSYDYFSGILSTPQSVD